MIIIRYHEIGLKGINRKDFEKRLRNNIKDCLNKNNVEFKKIWRLRGRILVDTDEECPQLNFVFGISTFSYADELPLDFDTLKQKALESYRPGTFRVTCTRLEKVFLPSPQIEQEVGAFVVEKTGAKVSLRQPQTNIQFEIFNNHAYLFTEKTKGPGGIPVCSEGRVLLLLQNPDSITVGIRMLKRGCALDVLKEKDINYSKLKEYEYGFRIHELKEIPDYAEAVIVSDTLDSIREYPYFVLRPLI